LDISLLLAGLSQSCIRAGLTALRDIAGYIQKLALLLARRTSLRRFVRLQGVTTLVALPLGHGFPSFACIRRSALLTPLISGEGKGEVRDVWL
jgi:hypothetical protein